MPASIRRTAFCVDATGLKRRWSILRSTHRLSTPNQGVSPALNTSVHVSYLGYGLLEAWSICLFFMQGANPAAGADPALGNLSSLAVTAGTLALLLLCHTRDAVPNHRLAMVAAGFLNAAATLCMLMGTGPAAVAAYAISGLVNA